MGGPSNNLLNHKISYLIKDEDDEDDLYLTQPFKPVREVLGVVIPRRRNLVRNSVRASDVTCIAS